MADLDDLERLVMLWGHVFDAAEWHRLDELLSADATFVAKRVGVELRGLDDITAAMDAGPHPLAHHCTNLVLDLEPGAATASGTAKFFCPRANGTAMIGTYRDQFARTDAGWRIVRREVHVVTTRWGASAR